MALFVYVTLCFKSYNAVLCLLLSFGWSGLAMCLYSMIVGAIALTLYFEYHPHGTPTFCPLSAYAEARRGGATHLCSLYTIVTSCSDGDIEIVIS